MQQETKVKAGRWSIARFIHEVKIIIIGVNGSTHELLGLYGSWFCSRHGLLSTIHVMPDIQLQLLFLFHSNGLIPCQLFKARLLANSLRGHACQKYSIWMPCNWSEGVVDPSTSYALMRQWSLICFEDHTMIYVSVSYSRSRQIARNQKLRSNRFVMILQPRYPAPDTSNP